MRVAASEISTQGTSTDIAMEVINHRIMHNANYGCMEKWKYTLTLKWKVNITKPTGTGIIWNKKFSWCWQTCAAHLQWFSKRCQNGQVESFHTVSIGSHWGAGWVLWVWSSSALEPRSRCSSKIGYQYHIMLTRISSSFGSWSRLTMEAILGWRS